MQWFSDLINPARPEKDPQEWLQLMSFFTATLLALCATYLVLRGSISGQNATSLLLGLVIIFMAGSGLLALSRVAANTTAQIQKEKFKHIAADSPTKQSGTGSHIVPPETTPSAPPSTVSAKGVSS